MWFKYVICITEFRFYGLEDRQWSRLDFEMLVYGKKELITSPFMEDHECGI